MNALQLVENYSYGVDTITYITSAVLLVMINRTLYFTVDEKFMYIKRGVHLIMFAALANVTFAYVCIHYPDKYLWIYLLRDIYHACLMSCMFLYIVYLRLTFKLKQSKAVYIIWFTRFFYLAALVLDVLSPFTKVGLCRVNGEWRDSIISPFNISYVYSVIIILLMLLYFKDRMIRTVRNSLIGSVGVVAVIMTKSAIENSSTFSGYTYLLPVFVVMLLLHSKPFDDFTGAMSSKSFDNFIEKNANNKTPMDYMVLRLKLNVVGKMPDELGKKLSSFWYAYFKKALLFVLEDNTYVLAIPRIESNGDTEEKARKLFYEDFPEQYSKYQLDYKIVGMHNIDFIRSSFEFGNIVTYIMDKMEEDSVYILDETERARVRKLMSILDQLSDIHEKQDMQDERVLAFCQPIKNVETGEFDTAEALMRLKVMGVDGYETVMPDMFIPLAENFGYIHTLSKIMLNKVCKQIRVLQDEGYSFKRISVNFAVSELRDSAFCPDLISIIDEYGILPSMIGIEITESQNENDFNIIKEKIAVLKERGITIYLDDFGTGYSNLDRILQLGFDVIKYDRSILLIADEDEKAAYIVAQFAQAFKNFKYSLLFEGVETDKQEELCRQYGADSLQGFKFSKPIPVEKLRDFFTKV